MQKIIVCFFSLLLVSGTVGAAVYKYINKQGKVAYADTPVDGAKKIIVPPVMTYKAEKISRVQGSEKKELKLEYSELSITHPVNEATLRSNQGQVEVSYLVKPELISSDRVVLYLDGNKQQGLSVTGLSRGAHTVTVQVIDGSGQLRIKSKPVVFYLHHHSALFNKSTPTPTPTPK